MKIKCIIVDDESKLRELLKIKIEKYCENIEVLHLSTDIHDAYDKISAMQPDLVFLDIAMPKGSGFALLERYENIPFEVIFVTGYNEYALNALKVSAVDYLLKPVINEQLIQAVEKAREKIVQQQQSDKYNVLKYNLEHVGQQESRIVIPGSNVYEFVQIKNIIRCEGWQKYTRIYLTNGKQLLSSYNIGKFTDMLEDYKFYLTHRSHLVNITHIEQYSIDGIISLKDGSKIPVSRRRRDSFVRDVIK